MLLFCLMVKEVLAQVCTFTSRWAEATLGPPWSQPTFLTAEVNIWETLHGPGEDIYIYIYIYMYTHIIICIYIYIYIYIYISRLGVHMYQDSESACVRLLRSPDPRSAGWLHLLALLLCCYVAMLFVCYLLAMLNYLFLFVLFVLYVCLLCISYVCCVCLFCLFLY